MILDRTCKFCLMKSIILLDTSYERILRSTSQAEHPPNNRNRISYGRSPPDPPKRRSAPLTAAVGRFFSTEPLVRGQLRCLGQNFSRISTFLEEATCSGQLRCLGRNFFQKCHFFEKKPLVPGSFAAWGRFFPELSLFCKTPLVPGSFAAWGRTSSSEISLC